MWPFLATVNILPLFRICSSFYYNSHHVKSFCYQLSMYSKESQKREGINVFFCVESCLVKSFLLVLVCIIRKSCIRCWEMERFREMSQLRLNFSKFWFQTEIIVFQANEDWKNWILIFVFLKGIFFSFTCQFWVDKNFAVVPV